MPPARLTRLCAAALVLSALLAYLPSLSAPFLFDDLDAIVRNASIRRLWSADVLFPPREGSAVTGRPLVNLSFALNHAISGLQVWSYHAVNLAIHAGAALALFGLARRALTGPVLAPRWTGAALPVAFGTALIWSLHPLQTESVTCVAQRTESLCGLFCLLTLYAFARAAGRDSVADQPAGAQPARRGAGWAVLAVIACLAGMATKEVMVITPLAALLLDRTFFAGSFAAAWTRRRGLHLTLAATWLLLAGLVAGGGGARGVAAGFGLGVSPWHYLLQQCEALVLYCRLVAWPHPLVLDYGRGVVSSALAVWWQGPLVLAALAGTAWALRRRPVAGFLGAWWFLQLAPSSSFVPLVTQTMAEHRVYLALAAPAAAVVALGWRHLRPPAPWLLGGTAVALAIATAARNREFRDPPTIWSSSVAAWPAGARGHNNLALALHDAGRPADAETHFRRALALDPQYVSAHYNHGATLLARGQTAAAVAPLAAAVALAPDHADAHLNLGTALLRTGRPAEAVPHFEHALRLRPAADTHFNLGVALAETDRPADATTHLGAALRLDPALAEAHYQLGRIAERRNDPPAAAGFYTAALRAHPDHAGAHRRLGLLAARRGDLADAASHFTALLRIQPQDADAHANLGNVRLLENRPREAVAHFEAAIRLRPDDARLRESLHHAREAAR